MNRPDKPFCEFCFSDDCDKCQKLKAYKQGREEAIEEVADKSLREAVIKTSNELMHQFAEKGNWKQVKREAVSLAEITCGWAWADKFAEQIKEQKNEDR